MRTFPLLFLVCLLVISVLCACSTARRTERFYAKTLKKEIDTSPVFARSFTGFTLLDAETGRTLCDVNGGHYFTPASNTKILTLATCLAVLGDSVPALRYLPLRAGNASHDYGLWFQGTGDPTFLHPKFQAWQSVFPILKGSGDLYYDPSHFADTRFGSGWNWDDFGETYSCERSALPIYGNLVHLTRTGQGWLTDPPFFQKYIFANADSLITYWAAHREYSDSIHVADPQNKWPVGTELEFPVWRITDKLLPLLLDTLQVQVAVEVDTYFSPHADEYNDWRTRYATPLDTVLRRMMYQSDNFIAEQMLLVCAGVKYDTLRQEKIIQWARDTMFVFPVTNTPITTNQPTGQPRWVDGSGLSRYNLVSPHYLTNVLWQLWREQPHDRLLHLFPTAGAPETTLEWWQPVPPAPWLFAKTGSMGGVQCISGYLRTKRGKTLIFSFMHNNFVGSGKPWRLEMRRILELVAG